MVQAPVVFRLCSSAQGVYDVMLGNLLIASCATCGVRPTANKCMGKQEVLGEMQTGYRIVAVAKELFHQRGVHATRVDEIVRAARVSRKEFDRSFRSKRQLAREVVLAYLAEIEAGSSHVHPKLASWSDFRRSPAEHVTFHKAFRALRGCPLAIIGNELTDKDDAVREVLSLVFEALTKRLTAFFRQQKTESHLSKSAKEEGLAAFCVAVIQGAMLIGKVRREFEAVESVLEEMVTHVENFRLGRNS